MPRTNRPRGRRGEGNDTGRNDTEGADPARALLVGPHTEPRHDGLWHVQPLAGASSTKVYTCPGCGLDILPGVAHTVSWRADGIMGEADDLAGRRHWHAHCWRIRV